MISLAVAGKGVWSGSSDGSIREWNVAGGRECLRQVTNVDRISHLVPIGDTVWTWYVAFVVHLQMKPDTTREVHV